MIFFDERMDFQKTSTATSIAKATIYTSYSQRFLTWLLLKLRLMLKLLFTFNSMSQGRET